MFSVSHSSLLKAISQFVCLSHYSTGLTLISKKRLYILLVSRDEDGTLKKIPIPVYYAYLVAAAAVVGLFTVTGLAGSYSRMLIKTARFNQLRQDHRALQQDYAHLAEQAHQKDIQAASLGSLATEVSALYGLTAGRLTLHSGGKRVRDAASDAVATAPLKDASLYTTASYYRSLDAFYALRDSDASSDAGRLVSDSAGFTPSLGRMANPLMAGHDLIAPDVGDDASTTPSLWPVIGPITSSFGERQDPVLGGGEAEFHPGVDISGPLGTPIHATADGIVSTAEMVNGYGRMVRIDHGHGVQTCYGHMSGFAVTAGQSVSRGQVIGYIGHSGRTTGNHVHYEVRIHTIPVNPHKYLRTTLADLGQPTPPTS